MREIGEIDLSTPIDSSAAPPPRLIAGRDAPTGRMNRRPTPAEPAPDIEDVFAQMRAKSAREQQASAALGAVRGGASVHRRGTRSARRSQRSKRRRVCRCCGSRRRRGSAGCLIDRGDLNEGVEWLERAAEAPAPSPEEGHDLLYELAGALEAQGESARALAILMELDAEADGYRDVRTRIMYLTRGQQTESHRS